MSSKFRKDGFKRTYKEQTYVRKVLASTLSLLLFLVSLGTLIAFYVMIQY